MCGVAGIVDFHTAARADPTVIERMCGLLAHRGPNHQGTHVRGGVSLGHRRLTITDLVTGQQPLANEDGTVWVVFNGEIYNYKALRRRLETTGHRFVTRTDTEVIPHLYEEYGLDFVDHMEGNWAIGLWDERHRRLILTRDRIGKKPLVWACRGGVVRFASEAKALFADPAMPLELDRAAWHDVVRYGHVVEDGTMFDGVRMVLPAGMLVFEDGRLVSERRYWDCADVPEFEGDLLDALDRFSSLFSDVTAERLLGDVPYGLLLSGGIDSTLVASYIIEHQPALKTYTISREDSDDETDAAGLMARHIGSDHQVIGLAEADPALVAARIPWMFDQPFFNDATFANYLIAKTIAPEVTVAITGDGGDHIFSGTLRHLGDLLAGRLHRYVPPAAVAVGYAAASAGTRVTTNRRLRRLSKGLAAARVDDRERWLRLRQQDLPIRHKSVLGTDAWRRQGHRDPDERALAYYDESVSGDHLNRLLHAETRFELPPNDLLKVDRAFMYNQVAGRAPFLDRRIVEFAASLPACWKRQGKSFKWFLRRAAKDRIPPELVGLPKTGLGVPIREWLRGPLGARVARVIGSESFGQRGVFDQRGALALVERHRSGHGDYGRTIWTMAMAELFHRTFFDSFGEPDERIWE